jgi:hypothetical protein
MILVDGIVMYISKHERYNGAQCSFWYWFVVLLNTRLSFKQKLRNSFRREEFISHNSLYISLSLTISYPRNCKHNYLPPDVSVML